MSVERRAVQRRRRFVFGTVHCPDGRKILCAVRDSSAMGAQVEVEDARAVPETFSLQIDGVEHARDCIVVWRNFTKIGVAYLPKPLEIEA